jgi:predicted transcriptional regulator
MSEIKVEKQIPDNFTMVYNHCLEKLNNVYDISVYVWLSKFAANEDKSSFPSYQTIADKVGCSRNKVISSMKNLVNLGLVSKKKRRMQTSIYTIIHPINLQNEVVHDVNSQTSKVHEVNSKGAGDAPEVVHEVCTNYTHLTKPTSNYTQEGAKAPALKKTTEDRYSDFEDSLREYHKNNPSKYPKEMYVAFRDYWGEKNKSGKKLRFEKQEFFELGKRLATWASREKSPSNKSNSNKSFAEQEYEFKNEKLRENLDWIKELQEARGLNMYEGEQVGKIN